MGQIVNYDFRVKIYSDADEMGRAAAADAGSYLRELLEKKAEVNCIFAAAPSQSEMLKYLCEEKVDWSRVNAFHMDEYIGLEAGDPRLFASFLGEAIFNRVPFKKVYYINRSGSTQQEILENYSRLLQQYPVDVTFMGIGENGHIAFNDPHVADFHDPRRIKMVDLDATCRMQQVHDGCFETLESVPKYAMTLTIPSLVRAGRIFCIVPSLHKAEALKDTVLGAVSEKCPASVLRRHPAATVYADADAGRYLMEQS